MASIERTGNGIVARIKLAELDEELREVQKALYERYPGCWAMEGELRVTVERLEEGDG